MESDDPADLRAFAERCRRLARGASTEEVTTALLVLADEYERQAAAAGQAAAPAPEPPNPQQGG